MNKLHLTMLILLTLCANTLFAQSLEPRLYSNAPTDLNFLVVGYGYSQGALASTPELELKDPDLKLNIGIVAYARGFDFFGKCAKVDVIIPTVKIDGDAIVNGTYKTRNVSGLGDIKARVSLNVIGSPALILKDFSTYKQDTIIGMSLQVTAPSGKYENDKLINIGRNIWAVKIGAGVSKALGNFTLEFLSDAEFYTTNNDYYGSTKKGTDPVYSVQGHLIYNIQRGMWVALNSNYYWGGNSYIDGVSKNTDLKNSRLGFVFTMPINKQNSIKLSASDGVSTRTGTDFTTAMLFWQYRFGGGI
ncbi:MAG: transporter [Sulfurimonas sp.]|nr:transporter [Sulfurimonas sp.]